MKVRVFKSLDGVSVIHPAPKSRRFGESEVDWLNRVFTKAMPQGVVYEDMNQSELPSREYRNAWELVEKKVKINAQKKQEIIDKKTVKVNALAKIKQVANLTDEELEAIK